MLKANRRAALSTVPAVTNTITATTTNSTNSTNNTHTTNTTTVSTLPPAVNHWNMLEVPQTSFAIELGDMFDIKCKPHRWDAMTG